MGVGPCVVLAVTLKNKNSFCDKHAICGRASERLELLNGLDIEALNSLFCLFHSRDSCFELFVCCGFSFVGCGSKGVC